MWLVSLLISDNGVLNSLSICIYICNYYQSNETTVEVNITCCHPGYHFDNETELCKHNHNDPNIVRPGPNNRYLYMKVIW